MLLSVLFGVPWWVWPVFYFSVGFLWAMLYLPRAVIHRHWVAGMPQYLADDAYCQKLVAGQGAEVRE